MLRKSGVGSIWRVWAFYWRAACPWGQGGLWQSLWENYSDRKTQGWGWCSHWSGCRHIWRFPGQWSSLEVQWLIFTEELFTSPSPFQGSPRHQVWVPITFSKLLIQRHPFTFYPFLQLKGSLFQLIVTCLVLYLHSLHLDHLLFFCSSVYHWPTFLSLFTILPQFLSLSYTDRDNWAWGIAVWVSRCVYNVHLALPCFFFFFFW